MLSRVADSIYWMNRYIERAENVARFIDVNLNLMLDLPMDEDAGQWEPLIITTGDSALFHQRFGEATQQNVIQFLTFDDRNPNSIVSCLRAARENGRTVREVISSEMWEQINRFYLMVRAASVNWHAMDSLSSFYNDVKLSSHLFCGVTDTTMSHNEGWHFANLGRLFERADKTARILDVKYFILLPNVDYIGSPFDTLLWSALLKSASAYEMYRKRFRAVQHERVAAFLILDREFPRSIHWCVRQAEHSLHEIAGSPMDSFSNPAEQLLGRLRSEMDYAQIHEIVSQGLHEYLDRFQAKLNDVGQAVHDAFFSLRPAASAPVSARSVQ